MKRLLTLGVLFFATICSYSQECLTSWPYIYPNFRDGIIYLVDGGKLPGKVNIHLRKSTLHYLEGNKIKESQSEEVLLVTVGEEQYMCVEGQMMRVTGSEKTGFVATLILADFNKLTETGGAYGASSSAAATRKLSSLEADSNVKMNHMELLSNKDSGVPLSLNQKYYIVTKGTVYEASRRGIESKLPKEQQAAFKLFLKNHKIQWKNPQDLLTLLDFLNKN